MTTFTTIEQVAQAVKAQNMDFSFGGRGASRYYQVKTIKLQHTFFCGKPIAYNTGETVCLWSNQKDVLSWANTWLV